MRRAPVIALVVWTFLVWTTRIGIVLRDDDLDTGGKVGRTALALGFTIAAVAVLVALWRRPSLTRRVVEILAGWTIFIWAIRGTAMLVGDHEAGFKVVHTILAVVSIALAAWALKATAEQKAPGPHPERV